MSSPLTRQNLDTSGSAGLGDLFDPAKRAEYIKNLSQGETADSDVATDTETEEFDEDDESTPETAVEPQKPQSRTQRAKRPGASAVYVDSDVEARLKKYGKDNELSNLQIILEAVGAKVDVLQEVVEARRIVTRPVSDLFDPDPNAVRFRGGGQIPITYRPTPAQAAKLDEFGSNLGFQTRSTWLAPVLDAYLPKLRKKRSTGG
ncbi:hypothetical protein [Nocardia sp. XZ_19_369]|uniref:hypothetical protein n=1 Tax=Nocardia sp. XZ_19_369 TaxID=2769487 RepID=UPI001890255E|nr:hypothetical protein [Nocardia sp. XZ_19_369]